MDAPIPIGICVAPERVPELAAGYDFIELTVASVLNPLENDIEFAPKLPRLAALRPPVRAFNVFVPAQVKLVGPEVNPGWLRICPARPAARERPGWW